MNRNVLANIVQGCVIVFVIAFCLVGTIGLAALVEYVPILVHNLLR